MYSTSRPLLSQVRTNLNLVSLYRFLLQASNLYLRWDFMGSREAGWVLPVIVCYCWAFNSVICFMDIARKLHTSETEIQSCLTSQDHSRPADAEELSADRHYSWRELRRTVGKSRLRGLLSKGLQRRKVRVWGSQFVCVLWPAEWPGLTESTASVCISEWFAIEDLSSCGMSVTFLLTTSSKCETKNRKSRKRDWFVFLVTFSKKEFLRNSICFTIAVNHGLRGLAQKNTKLKSALVLNKSWGCHRSLDTYIRARS